MSSKQTIKILGTVLFLYGVFGYVFPNWGDVHFTNSENLWHVCTGLLAIFISNLSVSKAKTALLVFAVVYLALGLWGFTFRQPTDFHIGKISAQADPVDNYAHIVIGLAFSWFWLHNREK